jgi:hypothetical protein
MTFDTTQLPIVMLEMNAISIKENEEVEEPNTGIRRRTHVTSYIIAAIPEIPATAIAAVISDWENIFGP